MTDAARPEVTVVIPVHNEADYLPTALPLLIEEMGKVAASIEILFAENGSTDATAALIREAMETQPGISLIQLPTPDYGAAMRAGFLQSDSEWVVNFDIDYFSADFLDAALEAGDAADIVLASKRVEGAEDERGALRRLATFTFNQVLRVALDATVSDTHGMKLVRRSVVETVVPSVISTVDLFDTELVVRAERAGFRIVELPARVEELRDTKSSVLKRVPRTLAGVWRIRRSLRDQ